LVAPKLFTVSLRDFFLAFLAAFLARFSPGARLPFAFFGFVEIA